MQPSRWLDQLNHLLLGGDRDYIYLRISMVVIFLLFSYTKWHLYAVPILTPIVSHSPILWPLYYELGIRGTLRFLGTSELIIFALLFSGFWDKRLGLLGALGSTATFITTILTIPFIPGGWSSSAGGFPAMAAGDVPFLMEDVVLLAASAYLLKQDALRLRGASAQGGLLNLITGAIVTLLDKSRVLDYDIEYYLLRGSLVIVLFFFGYEKWFFYGADELEPFISNVPFLSWLYDLFDVRVVGRLVGAFDWSVALLLILGVWNRRLGLVGAILSAAAAVISLSLIPFLPNGWDSAAGGFPAMTGSTPFLLKNVVFLAVSVHSIKQDLFGTSGNTAWRPVVHFGRVA